MEKYEFNLVTIEYPILFGKALEMKRNILLLVIAVSVVACCFALEKESHPTEEKQWFPAEIPQEPETYDTYYHSRKPAEIKPSRTYGDAQVSKITGVDADFFFRCNIKQWPAVIGENIPVRISGVSARINTQTDISKEIQQEAKEFIAAVLAKAAKQGNLVLKNIRRGKGFYLIADVMTGEDDLAQLLIEKGYAKKAKPGDIAAPVKRPDLELRKGTGTALNGEVKYMASKSSNVFHRPDCRFAKTITSKNGAEYATRQQAINSGRRPCKQCKP